ncbi:tetratricopeptide repeat protein, partial [Streptomyces mirabilis]|uniref:tetratricopeptide repeat protein n=1 Tax=Streptomyces mirabilis TaxID=68239 RepID=UPI00344153DE
MGAVPALASAFQPRTGLRERIEQARAGHATVVLTQVLSGGGGVGKSQLAAAYAHHALSEGTELVVWVNASETQQVVAGYSDVARRIQAPGAGGQDAETDARAFLAWLAVTSRSWLVVLDDLADVEEIAPWWPPPSRAGHGRVLVTTRRRDALLSGGGRAVVEVDAYTPAESMAYLRDRFTGAQTPHLLDVQAEDVVRKLGYLPLALALAAAYMINEDVPCTPYLEVLTDCELRLETLLPHQADTEGYGRQIAAALLLTLDAAQQCNPVGLAAPALRLASHLDPAGHPQTLWADAAVTRYLTTHRSGSTEPAALPPPDVTTEQARSALRLLHRYGLITCDSRHGPRAVRLHALTARAARETTPTHDVPATVRATTDALAAIWPETDHTDPDLCSVLRANTDTLAAHAGDLLWQSHGHAVLYRAGKSLLSAGLYAAALTHWHHLATTAGRLLGPEHSDTLTARANLGTAYREAGRTPEAITLLEQVVADAERGLGPEHPDTFAARTDLGTSYRDAGRTPEAITLLEQVVADAERLLD